MSRSCFERLLIRIKNENPCLKDSRKYLYIFIFFVTHLNTYRKTREIFGTPKSTIFEIVKKIGKLLYKIAIKEVCFPVNEEFDDLKSGFSRGNHNFHNVILAIDGTHFEITKPKSDPLNYYNRHGYFSLNVIAAIDYKKRFRSMTPGFGKSHDSMILSASNTYTHILNLENDAKLVGDAAFRVFRNILVPRDDDFNQPNLELKLQRIHVENTFALFKNKFKRFSGKIINGEKKENTIMLYSSVWVHNFIINNS